MSDDITDNVTAIFLMLAIFGALVLMLAPKENEVLKIRGLAFFAGGMAGTAGLFLLTSPDVIEDIRRNVGLALIGMVIASLGILRFLNR